MQASPPTPLFWYRFNLFWFSVLSFRGWFLFYYYCLFACLFILLITLFKTEIVPPEAAPKHPLGHRMSEQDYEYIHRLTVAHGSDTAVCFCYFLEPCGSLKIYFRPAEEATGVAKSKKAIFRF